MVTVRWCEETAPTCERKMLGSSLLQTKPLTHNSSSSSLPAEGVQQKLTVNARHGKKDTPKIVFFALVRFV